MGNRKKEKPTLAFAKRKIALPNGLFVDKDDVGILEGLAEKTAKIFFVRQWKSVELEKEAFQIFDFEKTGDSFSKKICNVCHKLLSTQKFARNQNGKGDRPIRRPSCHDCRKALEGKHMSSKTKAEWKKKKPEHTPFECPICSKRTIAGITSKVVLDHDHENGDARGWICDSCNTGIGRFKDDPVLMKRAIKFIEEGN